MKNTFLFLIIVITTHSFLNAQIVHDDPNSRVQLGSKLFLQYRSESHNDWMRGFVSSTIKWDKDTHEWSVGNNTHSDFSMMQFSNGGNIIFYSGAGTGSKYSMSNGALYGYARMAINTNGFVGIGTRAPQEKLHVVSDNLDEITWPIIANNAYNNSTTNGYGVGIKLKHSHSNEEWKWGGIASVQEGPWANLSGLAFYANETEFMRIKSNGNVGIGTMSPDMKLTVKGNIHAEEVKIDLNVPAPDYVFKKNYKLRTIEEVEKFIEENSHLPEIPSAKEFEQNGVMQAEMDMNLLKKIEELTLYTIQQQKEIESLKKENNELKSLSDRLAEIEKLLESKK